MAKANKGLLKGVLLGVGGVFLFKTLFDDFSAKIQFGTPKLGFKGITLSPFGALLSVTIPITNNNRQSVSVTGFEGELWYGPIKMATIRQPAPVQLAARATSNYVVEASVDLTQLPEDVKKQIQTKQYLQYFFLKGRMKVGAIWVPINEQLTMLF